MRYAINLQKLTGFSSAFALAVTALLFDGNASAARISDIKNTNHNLSIYGPGSVRAAPYNLIDPNANPNVKQTEICVYCHTPHGGTKGATPLWNRKLSSATYTPYTSSSLDAAAILGGPLGQPGGSSKLCLSCHDGTLAIGNVNVMFGRGSANTTYELPMYGLQGYTDTADTTPLLGGKMPFGGYGALSGVASAVSTGYTRNLGIDLTNDHPISVTYTTELAERNGELRLVDSNQQSVAVGPYYRTGMIIGVRSSGYRPEAPLEPTGPLGTGQVQCSACHDPHLRETDPSVGNQKFLRLNRFQEAPPAASYNGFTDIGCMACHDKNFTTTIPATNAGTWAYSVHANPQVSTIPQTYITGAAQQNEFPTTTDGAMTNLPVWKASCLNCHDTHTVQGSRWLLREGTDSTSVPKVGGNSAIEETCYQCHSPNSIVENGNPAKDIKSDFESNTHMPITLADQQGNLAEPGSPPREVHAIGGNFNDAGYVDCSGPTNKCGADFVESRENLGVANLGNRHAECSDCHNPHRAVKFQSFEGNPPGTLSGLPDAQGTHKFANIAGYTPSNIASGALRGTFGVEPLYGSASFNALAMNFLVKRGDPTDTLGVADCAGINKATCDNKAYVTREYEICMKCHSDYGYSDTNTFPYADLPEVGGAGLTARGTNALINYTNQAREFQSPSTHKGELPSTSDSGAGSAYSANNHRSWHPVIDNTGRTGIIRGNGLDISNTFNLPWSNSVGTETMYCSDCHGSNVNSTTSVIPDSADPTRATWGPHGSSNNFILKGAWDGVTGTGQQSTGLCFKCHDYASYAQGTGGGGKRTGFWLTDLNQDGHQLHVDRITADGGVGSRCDWCHTAVPHGWKNKALLVNLNDVGPEAGQVAGTEVRNNTTLAYTAGPYYLNAVLKVQTFAQSGQWTAADCGSSGVSGNGQTGLAWMKTSNENCTTPP